MPTTPIPGNSPGTYPVPGTTGYVELYCIAGYTLDAGNTAATTYLPNYAWTKSGPILPIGHTTILSIVLKVQWKADAGITATFTGDGSTAAGDGTVRTTSITLASSLYPALSDLNNGYWPSYTVTFSGNSGGVTPGTAETRSPSTGTNPDGSYTIYHSDGTYTVYRADGSTTTYNSNGSVAYSSAATSTSSSVSDASVGAATPSGDAGTTGTGTTGTDTGSPPTTPGGGTSTGPATGTVYDARVEVHYSAAAGPTVFDPSTCTQFSLPLNYYVSGNPWKSTGISVGTGFTVTITAAGSGTYDGYTVTGPNGIASYDSAYDGGTASAVEMAVGRGPYSLVATIQPSGTTPGMNTPMSSTYQLGTAPTTITAATGGVLWLGYNERYSSSNRTDNTGGFCVTIGPPTPPTGTHTNSHPRITGNAAATTANPCDEGYVVFTTTSPFYYGSSFSVADFTRSGPTLPSNAVIENLDIIWQYAGDALGEHILLGTLNYDLSYGGASLASSVTYTAHNPSRIYGLTAATINTSNWFSETVNWLANGTGAYAGMLCDMRIEAKFRVPCAGDGGGGDGGGDDGGGSANELGFLLYAGSRRLRATRGDGSEIEIEWDSSAGAYLEGTLRDGGLAMPDGYWQSGWRRGTRRRLQALAVDPPADTGHSVVQYIEGGAAEGIAKDVRERWERMPMEARGWAHKTRLNITETSPEVRQVTLREVDLGSRIDR